MYKIQYLVTDERIQIMTLRIKILNKLDNLISENEKIRSREHMKYYFKLCKLRDDLDHAICPIDTYEQIANKVIDSLNKFIEGGTNNE